ncbi:growth/differentiation factor 5-like [Astyanax mexicanus]|uniref:growth/differentiation factor 5-like n=1 Tax=Astyanax mexicanus TaxID=7994 RepID=UPI0020CB59D6|nr:growth/differentiation factor 5-like [Astyanax mexicanus]
MSLLLFLSVMLIGCPLLKTFILHPEEPAATQPSPAIRTSRCQAKYLQSIRKIILSSLDLPAEPQVSFPGMTRIRDLWKGAFQATSRSEHTAQQHCFFKALDPSKNRTSSEISIPGNSSVLQCCRLTTQIFIKDLGWDRWIIYPESLPTSSAVDVTQRQTRASSTAGETARPPHSSDRGLCCEPTVQNIVPFLYLDETGSITIASVPLTSECGCRSESNSQAS